MGRPKLGQEFRGCDEDCLNCAYPDCLKPSREMKPTREVSSKVIEHVGKSQQRMFTLELGGVGKNMPNISRKFYL